MSDNQTEKEFFAIEGRQRKGLEEGLDLVKDKLFEIAAENIRKHPSVWMQRAITSIVNSDELKPVLASRAGIFSIIKGLSDMAVLGLQPGGMYPHFSFMPAGNKAVPVVSAEGFAFCSTHGNGAVLAHEPEIIPVYDADEFKIMQAEKIVKHEFEPFSKDRGALVGWYAELQYLDGRKEIPTITQDRVKEIIHHYSRSEFKDRNGKTHKMPAYEKSEFEMFKKTAAKQLLKKPLAESKGRAMLVGDYFDTEPIEDQEERTSSILGRRAASIKENESIIEDIPDEENIHEDDIHPEEMNEADPMRPGEIKDIF